MNKILFALRWFAAEKLEGNELESRTIVLIALLAIPVGLVFAGVNFLYARTWLAVLFAVFVLLLLPCFRLIGNLKHLAFIKKLVMVDVLFTFVVLFIDGSSEYLSVISTLMFPFLAILVMGSSSVWYWNMAYLLALLGLIVAQFFSLSMLPYDDVVLSYLPAAFLFSALAAWVLETHFKRAQLGYKAEFIRLESFHIDLEQNIDSLTDKLISTHDELEREVASHRETSSALKDTEERFYQAQKMEMVGTLVGGIAHDFNNILAGINANLFMIKRKSKLDSEMQNKVTNVENLVKRASDMIRQLLTFARKDKVHLACFDLTKFLHEAYKLASVSISEKIDIQYKHHSSEIFVEGNATQLQQVLMNMLNNARDALRGKVSPQIIIQLQPFEPDLNFKSLNPEFTGDAYAKLSISDNGQGIAAGTIDKIFEPFFTTKEEGKGTGLGLAMCYGAIQSHHGAIKVQSEQGVGTTFDIYIPISSEESVQTSSITTAGILSTSGEGVILLVDDDEQLRETQKEALGLLGYEILEAENGLEAVTLFEEHHERIDLVIMDVTMPIMGGVKASQKIRAIKKDTKILFVTGYDKDDTLNGERTPGMDELVLEKPYTMSKLNKVIQSQLL